MSDPSVHTSDLSSACVASAASTRSGYEIGPISHWNLGRMISCTYCHVINAVNLRVGDAVSQVLAKAEIGQQHTAIPTKEYI